MLEVFNLADKPEYIQSVVDVFFQEWGSRNNINNHHFWESWVRYSLSKEDIPQTLIGLKDNTLIATAGLWRCDLQSRQDLFPWFGGLWIKPEYRLLGFGTRMQMEALKRLQIMGYRTVYLFTDLNDYYEKTGWVLFGYAPDEHGSIVKLYKHDI